MESALWADFLCTAGAIQDEVNSCEAIHSYLWEVSRSDGRSQPLLKSIASEALAVQYEAR